MSAERSLTLATLPSVSGARLPVTYEAATRALAECSSIDECQDWADKAQAMASYARQAKDETLRKMADRIQARAIRRCGELLRQVPAANGKRTDLQPQDGHDPKSIGVWSFENGYVAHEDLPPSHPQYRPRSREQVATDAGLSERQRKTALRVAAVPVESFAAQVESESPPTITELAKQGTASKPRPLVDLAGVPAADYARATEAMGMLRRFADYCAKHEPQRIAHAFQPYEVADVRACVQAVDAWLDGFIVNLRS